MVRGSRISNLPAVQALGLLAGVVILGQLASGDPYWIGLFTTGAILYIVAASLDLLFGCAGLFSLGQQGLYAVGAYASVLVGVHVTSLPWIVDVLAAMAITAVIGFLLALPTARLRGEYLALATIAFGAGVQAALIDWTNFTGGPDGLSNVPYMSIFGHSVMPGSQEFLWVCGVAAAITFLVCAWMMNSRLGRSLRALRDSPLASQSVGINPVVTRSIAFAASGALAGLAGALFAAQQLFIEPDQFDFTLLIGILVAVLIGGPGRRFGPVIGAIVLTALQKLTDGLGSMEGIIYAALLAIIILAFRDGVIGTASTLWGRWQAGRSDPATGGTAAGAGADADAAGVPPTPARRLAQVPRIPSAPRDLKLDHVSVRFGGVHAVNDVSLELRRGEVLGLIGPNGAGKTTLVNVATGVLQPSDGSVTLGPDSLAGLSPHVVSRRGIARTFQHPQLSPGLTVLENAMLGLDRDASATMGEALLHLPRSRSDERRFAGRAMELLHRVGIAPYASAWAGSVPYGVQRRLEVARALACDPDFIFLDEAGAGLSEEERSDLIAAIQELAGHSDSPGIVVIEHNISFVRRLCPRSVVLVGGALLLAGETDEVLRDERVIDAYLGRPYTEDGDAVGALHEG